MISASIPASKESIKNAKTAVNEFANRKLSVDRSKLLSAVQLDETPYGSLASGLISDENVKVVYALLSSQKEAQELVQKGYPKFSISGVILQLKAQGIDTGTAAMALLLSEGIAPPVLKEAVANRFITNSDMARDYLLEAIAKGENFDMPVNEIVVRAVDNQHCASEILHAYYDAKHNGTLKGAFFSKKSVEYLKAHAHISGA